MENEIPQDEQAPFARLTYIPINSVQFVPEPWDPTCDRLLESIQEVGGIINPVTVVTTDKEGVYSLLAGRKRLQCLIKLNYTELPVVVVDPRDSADMSLHENLMRTQLPWPTEVCLVAEYHQRKQIMHGVPTRGRRKVVDGVKQSSGWGIAETAKALNNSVGTVHGDLALYEALQKNPNLAKITDKGTAKRLIADAAERMEREALSMAPIEWSTNFEFNRVFNGDSAEVLKQLPDGLFDACITDPPWTQYKDERLTADLSTIATFKEIYRLLKPRGFFYCIVSTPDFITWSPLLKDLGFQVQQFPLIWHKKNHMTMGRKEWQYARDYEPIMLAVKGRGMLASGSQQSSILSFPIVHQGHMIHPHEKPIGLIEKIIRDCTYEGNSILDPFAGSGVVAQAAKNLNRRYIAIERDPGFYSNICKRLEGQEVTYIQSPVAERNL